MRGVRPPVPVPVGTPLTPSPTEVVGESSEKVPTVRPPPGAEPEDPFGFEDEATAVITAEKAKALLEEQLPAAERLDSPASDETPMSFGTDTDSKPGAAEGPIAPRAKRESLRSGDDLVEQGPTVVVAETVKRPPSAPPPAKSPVPAPPARPKDFRSIQHERTRVIRAVKKPVGALFWVALLVALAGAAFAGYYASRLLEATRTGEPGPR